ncbi:MAG: ABC transporter ATP-binding protein [Fretibacterium sp.]|nr:ABC transporter ATP-binding protein [Fretibacterium sp.]
MSVPLLEVRDLRIETSDRAAKPLVRGVSFSVRPGRVTCLVGASGSGKSLSCMAVPDLLPQGVRRTGGSVLFEGRALERLSDGELRGLRGTRIAMVLQNPASCFDPVFSIRSHFRETLAAHGGDSDWRKRAETALREVGLEDADRICRAYPFQLSGGMLQRVMLALALLNDPCLLVADEPTTDLDTVAQRRVLDLIDAARDRRGMGVLLVTHDFGVVARMADDVVVLEDGAVVEDRPAPDLFESPEHPVTAALVEAHRALCERLDLPPKGGEGR